MKLNKIIITSILLCTGLNFLSAEVPKEWDFHAGFGFGMTASGLPSQISNDVAKYEKFIEGTENEKGFPFGTSVFFGTGYRFNPEWSLGFEYGLGYNLDIGIADVKIGSVVPDYVMDAFHDLAEKYPEFAGDAALAEAFAGMVYPGMTAKNNMIKGSYFDQKFLLYTKWTPNWGGIPIGFQLGAGLKMLHMLGYSATQSKNPKDYILDPNSFWAGSGYPDLDAPFLWNMVSVWASKPVNIPFPLKTKDGKIFMRQHQALFNTSFRFNIHMFYMDVDYATEFRYIHNTKVTLGVMFDANILDSFLKPKI